MEYFSRCPCPVCESYREMITIRRNEINQIRHAANFESNREIAQRLYGKADGMCEILNHLELKISNKEDSNER